jgi:hypothetical protein
MKDEIMNGIQGLPVATESNKENSREKAQKAQELSRFGTGIANFVLLRGYSVGVNSPDRLDFSLSSPVKLGQTDVRVRQSLTSPELIGSMSFTQDHAVF